MHWRRRRRLLGAMRAAAPRMLANRAAPHFSPSARRCNYSLSTPAAMGLPADVQALLEAHAPHFSATPEGKIKCELNGHTFPAQAQALKAFVK